MRAAFAYWGNRIAPVFDNARQIHIVETESGEIVSETRETVSEPALQKTLRLTELGVTTLVCGAISRPMHGLVSAYGIHVISFISGELQEVIRAWLSGGLAHESFAMPGCCGGRNRRLRTQDDYPEVNTMRRRGLGQGAGGGRQGQGGQGLGPLGHWPGATGFCFCPQCGQREPHQRGMPCVGRKCPNCGAFMTKQ